MHRSTVPSVVRHIRSIATGLCRTLWRGVALTLVSCLLSGCWWPEKFTATIEIDSDRTYHFRYEGLLTFVLAVAELKKNGNANRAKIDSDLQKMEQQLMKEDRGFKSVKYQGDGRFKVVYEKTGVVDRRVDLFSSGMKIVSLQPQGSGVLVQGMNIEPKARSDFQEIGLGMDGRIRVISGLEVTHKNAAFEPVMGLGSYEWRVTLDDREPPMLMTSGREVAKPWLASFSGANRYWFLAAGLGVVAMLAFLLKRRMARTA